MTATDRDWDLLTAYADGELAAAAAAALRRRIAAEPALAAELDRIRAVKASLGALRPRGAPSAPRRESRRPAWAALAAVAGLLALVALGGRAFLAGGEPGRIAAMASVEALHLAFAERSYVIDTDRALILSAGAGIGDVSAPDLAASNLTLVDVRVLGEGSDERIAMHYRGRRGCRLTLVVERLAAAWRAEATSLELAHRWATPQARYAMVADGMDRHRFNAIAAFAEALTRASDRAKRLRVAVIDRTEQARPCA